MTRRPLTLSEAVRISRQYGAQCQPGQPVQIIPRGKSAEDPTRLDTWADLRRKQRRIFARKRKFEALARREKAQ